MHNAELFKLHKKLVLWKIPQFLFVLSHSSSVQKEIALKISELFPERHVQIFDFSTIGSEWLFSSEALKKLLDETATIVFFVNFHLAYRDPPPVGNVRDSFFGTLNSIRNALPKDRVFVFMMPKSFHDTIHSEAPHFCEFQNSVYNFDDHKDGTFEQNTSDDEITNKRKMLEYNLEIYDKATYDKHIDINIQLDCLLEIFKLNNYLAVLHFANQKRLYYDFKNLLNNQKNDLEVEMTASKCDAICGVFYNQRDYAKALEWVKAGLVIKEKTLDRDHSDMSESYQLMGMISHRLGDLDQAFLLHNRALAIREKVLGMHTATSDSHRDIGFVFFSKGEYEKALQAFTKALEINEKVLNKIHPEIAIIYNDIGQVYIKLAKYDLALLAYDKAVTMLEATVGRNHVAIANAYAGIARIHRCQRHFIQALGFLKKALAIREISRDKTHPDIINTYTIMFEIYEELGEYNRGLVWLNKIVDIQKNVLGPKHSDTVLTYFLIASTYTYLGEYEKAWACFCEFFSEKILSDKDSELLTKKYFSTAQYFDEKQEYDKALALYNKAINIKKIVQKENRYVTNSSTAKILPSIGDVEYAEQWLKERPHYPQRKVSEKQDFTSFNNALKSWYTYRVARKYHDQRDYGNALKWYFKAMSFFEKWWQWNWRLRLSVVYRDIASVYSIQGKHNRALKWYRVALTTREFELGKRFSHARYKHMGDENKYYNYDLSISWYEKILDLLSLKHLDDKNIAATYVDIAKIYFDQHEYTFASEWYKKARILQSQQEMIINKL